MVKEAKTRIVKVKKTALKEPAAKYSCPEMKYIHDTLYVLNGKWKMLIILSLRNGNTRYREIARSIPLITFRMLSKELKELEQNKIISRKVTHDTPVMIEYALTEYSKTLWPLIREMINWGKNHRKVI
ncbi:winged helix-turn-helix transcriptional regulator [Chryseolinea lacunae]|uniref:Winged helix-turn-helix transcriptional regulator n=1 Tax=Chryseolinea lacunae TaxID=2801331 RepID=A0ABS1L2C4_9BACT|nr:winged helix-turn-helix transcriptional regulator [Chryseolinea lacunae]MBL0745688.1 winged helix-turn-helix transcriptional regulator [Chryseolinea lacunae]